LLAHAGLRQAAAVALRRTEELRWITVVPESVDREEVAHGLAQTLSATCHLGSVERVAAQGPTCSTPSAPSQIFPIIAGGEPTRTPYSGLVHGIAPQTAAFDFTTHRRWQLAPSVDLVWQLRMFELELATPCRDRPVLESSAGRSLRSAHDPGR